MLDDTTLLQRIERLLADGLATQVLPRAYSSDEVSALCRRLQNVAPDDVQGKLVIAGFTPTPYVDSAEVDAIEQSCATCMYFERHRNFCAYPQLMLPVAAEWSCILWRI